MTLVRAAILTISDRSFRGDRPDSGGPEIARMLAGQGWPVIQTGLLPDDRQSIQDLLVEWTSRGDIDLILTTGGTGFGPRDITPEATRAVIERPAPGLAEAMRAASLLKTPHAMLSRAEAGIRLSTLIVNLPGSPKGAVENLQTILPVIPHAVELLRGDPSSEQGHKSGG